MCSVKIMNVVGRARRPRRLLMPMTSSHMTIRLLSWAFSPIINFDVRLCPILNKCLTFKFYNLFLVGFRWWGIKLWELVALFLLECILVVAVTLMRILKSAGYEHILFLNEIETIAIVSQVLVPALYNFNTPRTLLSLTIHWQYRLNPQLAVWWRLLRNNSALLRRMELQLLLRVVLINNRWWYIWINRHLFVYVIDGRCCLCVHLLILNKIFLNGNVQELHFLLNLLLEGRSICWEVDWLRVAMWLLLVLLF